MKDVKAIALSMLRHLLCHPFYNPSNRLLELLKTTLMPMPLMLVGVFSLIALSSCTPTLDSDNVAAQIQAELEQEDLSLKAVVCPERVAIAPQTSFTCTGELDPQGTFPIEVTQTDEQGGVEWEVPNSKGLLNLATIETTIQEAIATEASGQKPLLDCGGAYRVNQPGDTFECKVANVAPLKAEQTETLLLNIVVKLDPQGNITWQQVRRQQTLVTASATASGTSAAGVKPATGANPTAASIDSPKPTAQPAATSAPAAGQTAEDFLNNPGAIDDF
jgi:Domain of unknown function (DUF4333)